MILFKKYYIVGLICFLAIVLAGCEKPGPISLMGPDGTPVIVPPTTKSLLTTDDIDPSGLFAPIDVQGYGQLLIEGSIYDSPTEHHTASVARAIFFDAAHPVYINRDTEFSTLNLGSIKIGQLTLNQVKTKYVGGSGDTTDRTQYVLLNQDGAGSSFSYAGNQTYTWQSSGNQSVSAFQAAVSGPPSLVVTYPSAKSIVKLSSDLLVHWTGGADTVRLYVRLMENGVPTKSIFQLKQQNRGGILVSRDLLSVLPHDQSQFMFSFTSSKTSLVKVAGFAGDVAVQAVTTHNLVLQVRP